jgi:hypothetical protein
MALKLGVVGHAGLGGHGGMAARRFGPLAACARVKEGACDLRRARRLQQRFDFRRSAGLQAAFMKQMAFRIRYFCKAAQVGDTASAATLEEARNMVEAMTVDLDCKAESVIIFRISPSGTEELEESTRLHV